MILVEFLNLTFDPKADIRISPTGCWEWASDKPLRAAVSAS